MPSTPPLIRSVHGESLFVGPRAALDEPTAVLGVGIEAVVLVAPEQLPEPWPRDLIVLRIPLSDDGENSPTMLRRAVSTVSDLIQDEIPTVVVCSAGLSRSVAVAAMALAKATDQSPNEILSQIGETGPADIMPGLWQSLQRVHP